MHAAHEHGRTPELFRSKHLGLMWAGNILLAAGLFVQAGVAEAIDTPSYTLTTTAPTD